MKKYIPNFICTLICFSIFNAYGQDSGNKQIQIFERDINNSVFNLKSFNDTVTFELEGHLLQAITSNTKKENWQRVSKLFKGTDYTLNLYVNENDKMKINGLPIYYELKNHKHIFIIGLNNCWKITYIKEIKLKFPLDTVSFPKN
jgi:hypothetical protein